MEFSVPFGADVNRIQIFDGVSVTPVTECTEVIDLGTSQVTVTVTVIYDSILERLAVQSIRARADIGSEITGVDLRKIRVQDFLSEAVHHMVWFSASPGHSVQFSGIEDYLSETASTTEDRERHAGMIYAIAKLVNKPPLKAVAEAFGVSQSTATRLVSRWKRRDNDGEGARRG